MVDIAVMITGTEQTDLQVFPGSIQPTNLKASIFRETFTASVSDIEKKGSAISPEISTPAPAGRMELACAHIQQAAQSKVADDLRTKVAEESEVQLSAKGSSTDVRSVPCEQTVCPEPGLLDNPAQQTDEFNSKNAPTETGIIEQRPPSHGAVQNVRPSRTAEPGNGQETKHDSPAVKGKPEIRKHKVQTAVPKETATDGRSSALDTNFDADEAVPLIASQGIALPSVSSSSSQERPDETAVKVSAANRQAEPQSSARIAWNKPAQRTKASTLRQGEERVSVPRNVGISQSFESSRIAEENMAVHGAAGASRHERTDQAHASLVQVPHALDSSNMKEQSPGLMDTSTRKESSIGKSVHALPDQRGESYAKERPSDDMIVRKVPGSGQTLEVGVPGGAHGWLRVRAELNSDGTVHASMSSTSAAGAEMLRRELPALAMYLHHEQVPVSSLAVHSNAGAQQETSGMMTGDREGTGHRQKNDPEADEGQQEATSLIWNKGGRVEGRSEEVSGWISKDAYGGWLSVRA